MLYDYQYTIAAILLTLVLLIVNYHRRSYPTKSNRVFMFLLYCVLLTSAADMITFWTISFPSYFTAFERYASNIVYLILFAMLSSGYALYITALIDSAWLTKAAIRVYIAVAVLQAVLILTTPFTHLMVYYDADLVYQHGMMICITYILPIGFIALSILALILYRKKFTSFQTISSLTIYLIMIASDAIQLVIPRVDIFTLVCALGLVAIYIIYENPVYYTYRGTRCSNARALLETIGEYERRERDNRLIIIGVTNRFFNTGLTAQQSMEKLFEALAERLVQNFGHRVFSLDGRRYVLIIDTAKSAERDALARLDKCLKKPLFADETPITAEYLTRSITISELRGYENFAEHLIEVCLRLSVEELFRTESIANAVAAQVRYRKLEDAVLDGLAEDRLYVVYQPIYDIRSDCFRSAEALVRLTDPRLGAISPGVFIPIAEKNRSIQSVGEVIFRKVCAFLAKTADAPLGLDYVEVNLSMIQLQTAGLAERLIAIMEEYSVDPSRINLEITESVELNENSIVAENVQKLFEHGLTFSIDDYGSGFASANYLYQLPIRLVKVDCDIVRKAMVSEDAGKVFSSTLELIRNLGMETVVEGVETDAMLQTAIENGGHFIQGFYFSRPLQEEDFIHFMTEHQAKN